MVSILRIIGQPAQVAVFVALVAGLATLTMPNYYRSSVRILPMDSKATGNLGGLAAAAAAFGLGAQLGEGGESNYVDIVNSRWMKEKLLNTSFTYKVKPWRFSNEQTVTESLYAYFSEKNMDLAIKELDQAMFATRDLKSKVLTFSVETRSADLSQQVVQRMAYYLEDFVREKGRTRGGVKATFMEARLRECRQEMAIAQLAFQNFLERNRNYQLSGDPAVRLEGVRLENEYKLRQQLMISLAMSYEQTLLEEKNDMPVLNVLDPPNLPLDKCRPSRSSYILLLFLMAFATVLGWQNRKAIRARLTSSDILA